MDPGTMHNQCREELLSNWPNIWRGLFEEFAMQALDEDMLNHTYPDGGPFPEPSMSLVLLRSLELASAPSEAAKRILQRTAPHSLLYASVGLCRLVGLVPGRRGPGSW